MERSEPGGVNRSDRACREAPTRPPVASLPAVDLPRKAGEVLSLWHCIQFTESCQFAADIEQQHARLAVAAKTLGIGATE
jgi:hypothetical protein